MLQDDKTNPKYQEATNFLIHTESSLFSLMADKTEYKEQLSRCQVESDKRAPQHQQQHAPQAQDGTLHHMLEEAS